uniref:Phostensin/Taperin PP1-binding domain-containing protein n=1 Tax=Astyanax mexicanus TaxID=7994 RepID=A0A3B1IJD6_ASTMX
MSVSVLPEWKQLLLERKRREEEERERREREEEERLASMPAWKRGIIQRRRAKQEGGGDRDQVSVETIGPIRQNPFIRSQNSYKRENRRREAERENHGKEKETSGEDYKTEKLQRDSDKGRQVEVHIEEKAESIKLRRDGEEVTVVMESVKSSCSCTLDSHHWSNSHTVSDHKTENERLSKTGIVQEIRDHKNIGPSQESDAPGNKDKTEKSMIWHEQEELLRSTSISNSYHPSLKSDEALEPPAPKSPKHAPWMSGVAQQEIRIPRSVFFGVEEMAEEHKPSLSLEGEGQIVGGDKERGVERRESWKAGKPLTRVESLRERIRQREMERKKRGEVEGEGGRESDRSEGEGMEKGGGEKRREAEGAQRCSVMTGSRIPTKLPQPKSFTINGRNAQSPENVQKPPPSSPSSPSSISLSPSLAPSPTRSSPLFSIRSASGASSPSALSPSATPTIPEIPVPIPETNNTDEGRKKRYPTVEEIEVIGGYQNLENSCMVKNRGSPKGVRIENQYIFFKLGLSSHCLNNTNSF